MGVSAVFLVVPSISWFAPCARFYSVLPRQPCLHPGIYKLGISLTSTRREFSGFCSCPHRSFLYIPPHEAGAARRLDKQSIRLAGYFGGVFCERRHLAVPDRQDGFVVVTHPQGTHPRLVDVRRDAAGHAAKELLGLAHGLLLPLPLLHQGIDDGPLLLLAQMHHRAAGVILHAACFHISGVVGVVAMERFRDGGGDEEHPVQVVPVLTQRLAGEEFPGDELVVFRPLEIGISSACMGAAS